MTTLALLLTSLAVSAPLRTIDGDPSDWPGAAPTTPHTAVVQGNEWIYAGAAGDIRTTTDAPNAKPAADILEVRVTNDTTTIYMLIRVQDLVAAEDFAFGVGFERDAKVNGPGVTSFGDDANLIFAARDDLSPDTQLFVRNGQVACRTSGVWSDCVGAVVASSVSADAIELSIPQSTLSLAQIANVRLSLVSFVNDSTVTDLETGDATLNMPTTDALDVVSMPGQSGTAMERDLSDGVVEHAWWLTLDFTGNTSVASFSECRPGTYSSNGYKACITCAPGYEQEVYHAIDASECIACLPGHFARLAGTAKCAPCDPGHFAKDAAATRCDECAAGSFASLIGASVCQPCLQGKHSGPAAEICDDCDAGSFSDTLGSATCKLCAPGTFEASGGHTTCTGCAPGRYAPNSGMTECLACDPGSITTTYGRAQCESCAAGYYSTDMGLSVCSPCDAGTASSLLGRTSTCDACAPGSHAASSGTASCIACAPGEFQADSGAATCEQCAAGSFNPAPGQSSCSACPSGSFSKDAGALFCATCAAGSFSASAGQAACEACSPGTAASAPGLDVCEPCLPGTYAATSGSTRCLSCAPGTFSAELGTSACTACAAGTFALAQASVECLPCPAGTAANEAGSHVCTAVAAVVDEPPDENAPVVKKSGCAQTDDAPFIGALLVLWLMRRRGARA